GGGRLVDLKGFDQRLLHAASLRFIFLKRFDGPCFPGQNLVDLDAPRHPFLGSAGLVEAANGGGPENGEYLENQDTDEQSAQSKWGENLLAMLAPAEHAQFGLPLRGRLLGADPCPPRRARGIQRRHHCARPGDEGGYDETGKRNQHIGDHHVLLGGAILVSVEAILW